MHRYAENSKLFVLGEKCHQLLLKFKKASDKLKEIKKEIEEVFNTRENPRAKRLLRTDEENNVGEQELFDRTVNTITPI